MPFFQRFFGQFQFQRQFAHFFLDVAAEAAGVVDAEEAGDGVVGVVDFLQELVFVAGCAAHKFFDEAVVFVIHEVVGHHEVVVFVGAVLDAVFFRAQYVVVAENVNDALGCVGGVVVHLAGRALDETGGGIDGVLGEGGIGVGDGALRGAAYVVQGVFAVHHVGRGGFGHLAQQAVERFLHPGAAGGGVGQFAEAFGIVKEAAQIAVIDALAAYRAGFVQERFPQAVLGVVLVDDELAVAVLCGYGAEFMVVPGALWAAGGHGGAPHQAHVVVFVQEFFANGIGDGGEPLEVVVGISYHRLLIDGHIGRDAGDGFSEFAQRVVVRGGGVAVGVGDGSTGVGICARLPEVALGDYIVHGVFRAEQLAQGRVFVGHAGNA